MHLGTGGYAYDPSQANIDEDMYAAMGMEMDQQIDDLPTGPQNYFQDGGTQQTQFSEQLGFQAQQYLDTNPQFSEAQIQMEEQQPL